MNTITINLTSAVSDTYILREEVYLSDITEVVFDVTGMSFLKAPLNIKFNWGDGSPIYTEINNFFAEKQTLTQTIYGNPLTVVKEYRHTYSPQANSLTTKLSCQAKVKFFDNTSCVIVQPFTIYSPSFHEKIEDLTLSQTSFIDTTKSILYTFQTKKDGSVIESVYFDTAT
jgi:hypothetical protein